LDLLASRDPVATSVTNCLRLSGKPSKRLDRTIEDDLTLAALRMALEPRRPLPGLVHHSDRGSQYAFHQLHRSVQAHGCEISMSRKSGPWENAGCESWMKTLEYEEV
jgi:putative transposase